MTTLEDDFSTILDGGAARLPIASALGDEGALRRPSFGGGDSDRLAGTVVHRLIQRLGLDAAVAVEHVREAARHALRASEISELDDVDAFLDHAAHTYAMVCTRDDVRSVYEGGERLHEVPFTMEHDGAFLRGSIDCLVRHIVPGGSARIILLEFKTGRACPEHERQLELYARAAAQLFPDSEIDARLIYAG
jgi:ATP-dependent exoDNAse (exonuclease V) beta subunit